MFIGPKSYESIEYQVQGLVLGSSRSLQKWSDKTNDYRAFFPTSS